jgi:hypothetical protein
MDEAAVAYLIAEEDAFIAKALTIMDGRLRRSGGAPNATRRRRAWQRRCP